MSRDYCRLITSPTSGSTQLAGTGMASSAATVTAGSPIVILNLYAHTASQVSSNHTCILTHPLHESELSPQCHTTQARVLCGTRIWHADGVEVMHSVHAHFWHLGTAWPTFKSSSIQPAEHLTQPGRSFRGPGGIFCPVFVCPFQETLRLTSSCPLFDLQVSAAQLLSTLDLPVMLAAPLRTVWYMTAGV